MAGWDIVQQAKFLRGALAIVRHHHERVDGTGYPDRLTGTEIPLEARIAAVADVWDALTSDRAYRKAWPEDRAVEMMLANRGSHFAPDPLDALLELLDAAGIRPTGHIPSDSTGLDACHSPEDRHGSIQVAAAAPAPRLP